MFHSIKVSLHGNNIKLSFENVNADLSKLFFIANGCSLQIQAIRVAGRDAINIKVGIKTSWFGSSLTGPAP